MAAMVLTAAYCTINANDIKSYAKTVQLTIDVPDEDVTTFNSAGWKEVVGGIKTGSLAIKLNDDVTASAIDSIIWPLLGTVVAFEIRATQAARGTSNPAYTGNVLINATRLGGDVGTVAEKDFTFPTSGAIARATS